MLLEILKDLEINIENRDRESFYLKPRVAFQFLSKAFKDNHLNIKNINDVIEIIIANQSVSRQSEYQELQEVLNICKRDAKINNLFLIFLELADSYKDRSIVEDEKRSIHSLAVAYRNNYLPLNYSKDFKIFDLSFLVEREVRQSVLGKPLKVGKEYPPLNTGMLASMRIERWQDDEYMPYLTPEEKKLFKVKKEGDRLVREIDREKGNKLSGEYLYVLSPKGGLYAASPRNDSGHYFDVLKRIDYFRHSTFRAGQPVRCAGTFFADSNGKIIQIAADSGHYTPGVEQLFDATLLLLHNGFIDEECRVIVEIGSDKNLSAGEIKKIAEVKVRDAADRPYVSKAQVEKLQGASKENLKS